MASKIIITKSSLDSVVRDLQKEQENLTQYSGTLENELGSINNAWKGQDATKYTEKMRTEYKTLLKEFNDSLQSYIDYLSKVFDEYKKLDDKYRDKSIEV